MPQLDFLPTWNDALRLLESLVAIPGIAIIPDLRYPVDSPLLISKDEFLATKFKEPSHLYLWSSKLSNAPPKLSLISSGSDKGKYWICPSDDLPIWSFSANAPRVVAGRMKLYPGMISWKTNVFDSNSVGAESKRFVSEIRQTVKSQMTLVDLYEPTWVGAEAFDLFTNGKLILVDCGREYSIHPSKGKMVFVP